jgi:hypothetical protein
MARKDPNADEFCDDGKTRKLNRALPYGTVYSDGYEETKFVQNGIGYKGDGIPVGYVPAAERGLQPVVPTVDEVLSENAALKAQLDSLLKRVAAIEAGANEKPAAEAAKVSDTPRAQPPKETAGAGVSRRA